MATLTSACSDFTFLYKNSLIDNTKFKSSCCAAFDKNHFKMVKRVQCKEKKENHSDSKLVSKE